MTSRDEALALLKEAREALHWQKWLWEAGYVRRESSLSADRTIQRKNDLMDDAIAKIDALLAASEGERTVAGQSSTATVSTVPSQGEAGVPDAQWHEWRVANPDASMYEAFKAGFSARHAEKVKP